MLVYDFGRMLHPDHVWQLNKALYGLKQAPRTWFDRLSSFFIDYGFKCSTADPSLFVFHVDNVVMLLLLYVDDIILTGNDQSGLHEFINHVGHSFAIKDMGRLHFFLGIEVQYTSYGLFLTQSKYAREVLERANMNECNSIATPMMVHSSEDDGSLFLDPQLYRSIAGALQYLTFTRPDLTYCVNYLCQFMHAPTNSNFRELKRVLRYVKGSTDLGLRIYSTSASNLYAFADDDWARCPLT